MSSFIAREVIVDNKSVDFDFYIGSVIEKTKTKSTVSWRPTECNSKEHDALVDIYGYNIEHVEKKGNKVCIYWKDSTVNNCEIITSNEEEKDEVDEDEKKSEEKSKPAKSKKVDSEKEKEASKKTIDALAKKINVAIKNNLRETSKLSAKEIAKVLEDDKDDVTNAATKMYTEYLARDDLKTLKSLKSDSSEVVYEAIYLKKGKENEDEDEEENEEENEDE